MYNLDHVGVFYIDKKSVGAIVKVVFVSGGESAVLVPTHVVFNTMSTIARPALSLSPPTNPAIAGFLYLKITGMLNTPARFTFWRLPPPHAPEQDTKEKESQLHNQASPHRASPKEVHRDENLFCEAVERLVSHVSKDNGLRECYHSYHKEKEQTNNSHHVSSE
jgi:hypothetical protein